MHIRPFFLLYRNRLITCAVLSLLVALGMLFLTSAESPRDVGVLWNYFCGCPPEPWDARILLDLPTFTCLCMGLIMGIGTGRANTYQGAVAQGRANGEMRFLLTRPLSRRMLLLLPMGIGVGVIVLFPAAGMLLLLGWLGLVHAPALGHLVEIARLVPGAAGMGAHPGLMTVLAATQFGRYYAAAISVGLCGFALYYVQRWWAHSESRWLRVGAGLTNLILMLPFALMRAPRLQMWVFVMGKLGVQPSLLTVALHLAFAVGMLGSCWRIAQRMEV